MAPEEFGGFVRQEITKFQKIVRDARIEPQ
jgi:hypothetical protein